jgi:phage terminase large subunit GpA-like protein
MSKQVGVPELARELEGAIEHKERTGKTDKLRQVLVRTFGEAFESATGAMGLDAASLKRRATDAVETPTGYKMGEIPDGVRFLTLAVDVGGTRKPFDLMVVGWDLQRRRYLIDRRTVRQRLHPDGILRDMNPTADQADWSVLEEEIDRIYPFKSNPDIGLPIAVTTIDIKDGNATPFGVQFLRDMDKRRWKDWRKVRGIMGAKSQEAPEVAVSPRDYNTDTNGKRIEPPITVHNLGVHKLKTDVLETLAIEDGSPGCWNFPTDMPLDSLQQFFNEPYIDGKWVQNGPNESLDLGGHSEAGRQILEPDRKDRNWKAGNEPIWAKPVSLNPKGGDLAVSGEVEVKKPVAKTPGANLASILGSLDRG